MEDPLPLNLIELDQLICTRMYIINMEILISSLLGLLSGFLPLSREKCKETGHLSNV